MYPAIKYGMKYLWSILLLAVMSSIYVLVMVFVYDVYAVARTAEGNRIMMTWIYFATHARIGPWMLGIFLGYVLFKLRTKKIEVSRGLNAAMWIASLSLMVLVSVGTFVMMNPFSHLETTLAWNAVHTAFHRLAWAAACAWMIFACHHLKTGGIIRWFLELRQFQPICRMGLSMYLVHPVYQIISMFNGKQSLFLSNANMVSRSEKKELPVNPLFLLT